MMLCYIQMISVMVQEFEIPVEERFRKYSSTRIFSSLNLEAWQSLLSILIIVYFHIWWFIMLALIEFPNHKIHLHFYLQWKHRILILNVCQNRSYESKNKTVKYLSRYDDISFLSLFSDHFVNESESRFVSWNETSTKLFSWKFFIFKS
jgi:hypothetical protein